MDVEILHIDECPNWAETGQRARAALDATGHADSGIAYRLLQTSEEASRVPFSGSPTILLDGADAFPTADRIADLACRVYITASGTASMPTVSQLIEVIRQHE